MIDFHGSTGYGQAFTDSISGDWGGKPLRGSEARPGAALKQYPWLDGDHMCALGGSYGGYMINWIAGSVAGPLQVLREPRRHFRQSHHVLLHRGTLVSRARERRPEYQIPPAYAKHNPIDYVSQMEDADAGDSRTAGLSRAGLAGLSVFTALQRRGIPSELLYFPNENHWVLKPADSIQWYDTVLAGAG
jgi:hypothetical protein